MTWTIALCGTPEEGSGRLGSRPSRLRRSMLNSIWMRAARLAPLVVLATGVSPAPARAFLGGRVTTVEMDRAEMHGTGSVVSTEGYTVHELAAPTGTLVREYVSSEGTVFA